jgi:pilus assembly protein CpaE
MPSRPVTALLAVEPGVDPEDVQRSLPGDADFNVAAVVSGSDEALSWLRSHPADLLLVACAGYSDRALLLLDAVARQNPDVNVMVLGHGSPNGFLRRAFEAGADDIVMLPATAEQVRFEVHKMLARKQGSDAPADAGDSRLVCVLGPKGGTGKTLTSTNLAVALAQRGQRVALIDLDLQFGDVALCLGLPPEKTVYDLAQSPGALDFDKLDSFLSTHSSGVRTLIAPRRPDQASAVGAELLREIYSIMRAHFDWVIVDTPPGFTAEVITSIDSSTEVVMVGMLDSLSLKNTKLGLETLELMKYDPDRVFLLLNRAHSRVGISQSDVEAVLGRTPDVFIPSDREIPRTVNEGIPIVVARPQSEPAEAFGRLADLLVGESAAAEVPVPVAAGHSAGASAGGSGKRRLFGRKA